ncbi:MAG TPA: hypothetical protein DD426_12705, partial [Clostridiaceae bacterium]|nr:hypothetical protein [Clostridiaceae bacterium]
MTEIGKTAGDGKLILFQGVEYKRAKFQMLGININKYDDDKDNSNNHQDIIDEVKRQGGFTIICHPHLNAGDYWPIEKLKGLNGYLGIEIYNNNVRLNNSGRAVATDVWDELLSSGKRVFGFANDDMHIFSRVGGAYNMVLSPEKSKESII